MALNIIYGRAGSGKSYSVYQKIKTLVSSGERVFLCVPEQYTHVTERNIMELVGNISPFSCEVISFERIMRRVYDKVGLSLNDVISDTAKSVIMSRAISKSDLSVYSGMSSNEGFVSLMEEMVDQFKKFNISCEDVALLSEKVSNQMTGEKLKDIAGIYSKYQEILHERNSDLSDVLTNLKEYIVKSGIFENSYVFFDEFSSFIPSETDIICEISKSAKQVYITLCTDALNLTADTRHSLFAPAVITSDKLIKKAIKDNIPVNKSEYLNGNLRQQADSDIFNIEKYLFNSYEKREASLHNINIHSYFDAHSEVEHTASEIISLCRDKGFRYRDIAVICADLDKYSNIINNVFSKYKIKAFIDKKTPLSDVKQAQFVLGALRIYLESYSYESVFSYLRLGFCDIDDCEIDILEEYVLSSNITKSDWTDDEKWKIKMDKFSKRQDLGEKYLNMIHNARRKFLDSIIAFHSKIKGRHRASDMCKYMWEYMCDCGFEKKVKDDILRYEKESLTELSKPLTLIHNKIVSILNDISENFPDMLISPKEFYSYLSIAFAKITTGLLPTSSDCVTVGNVERTRIKNVKALFVLGATDSSFPKKISSSGIFNAKEKEILSDIGVEFIKTNLDMVYYDRFLIYSALTIPREYLYISYPVSSSENSRESSVISVIRKITGNKVTYISDENEDFLFNHPESAWNYLPTGLSQDSDKWVKVYKILKTINPHRAKKFENCLFYSYKAGEISQETLDKCFSDTLYTTVSRLQQFASCKFSYFMRFVLGLEPRSEYNIDFANIGTLAHSVFEAMCKEIGEKYGSFNDVGDSFIKKRIEEYVKEFTLSMNIDTSRLSKRDLFKIERLKDTLYVSFIHLIKHISESKFTPLGYEIKFDDNGLGCVEIDAQNGKKVKLTGIIDRADSFKTDEGEFVRVIDYKTGAKDFSLEDIFYGLDFQLLVYLDALTKSNPDYHPAGALYFRINDFIYNGKDYSESEKATYEMIKNYSLKGLISSEESINLAYDKDTAKINSKNAVEQEKFLLLFNHLENKARELAMDIFKGVFTIEPYLKGDETPCSYCNYKSVCKNKGSYRILESVKSNEVWERLEGECNVDN